ncbi:hypothetical protein BaRGS_00039272 [Batillaria attramentaria]|uniref:Uncharacterized protein n=1 Tax=Batillaria attramentaria TaxID=370345 RepID=A0ABD0J3F6_9CAEN
MDHRVLGVRIQRKLEMKQYEGYKHSGGALVQLHRCGDLPMCRLVLAHHTEQKRRNGLQSTWCQSAIKPPQAETVQYKAGEM